jgi:hypothetical protein
MRHGSNEEFGLLTKTNKISKRFNHWIDLSLAFNKKVKAGKPATRTTFLMNHLKVVSKNYLSIEILVIGTGPTQPK